QLALIALALTLAACAEPTFNYDKRGTTPAQLDRDLAQCKRQAFRPSRFSIWPSGRYDPDVLNRCMERRGYAVRPEDTR
ncbi:MAG: hypothetical protein ACJ79M_04455, partial [Myxococcales bacterium]